MFAVTYAVDLVVKGVIHATGDEIYGYTTVYCTASIRALLTMVYNEH